MKLNQSTQIEMLGDLVSPQPAFFLNTTRSPLHQPQPSRVQVVLESGVVVERAYCRGAVLDLATPVMSGEFHNATHRMPIFQFSEN
jgi:hypothetical protein